MLKWGGGNKRELGHFWGKIGKVTPPTNRSGRVFSCTGGAAPEAEKFIKQLAKKIDLKSQEEYCNVVSLIRLRIRFDILKACTIAFRGYRKPTLGVAHVSGLDYGVQSFDG